MGGLLRMENMNAENQWNISDLPPDFYSIVLCGKSGYYGSVKFLIQR
jgi:hypothetical protein